MKGIIECQEKVANDCGYSSWQALLEDIKGDTELIDFYVRILMTAYTEQTLDHVTELIKNLKQ